MKLSKYFSLEEFTRSDTARKLGIDNTPTPEHIQNLSDMCVNLLDPIREAWGRPLIVTSGYRGYKLNAAVKGSKTSAHCYGLAADIIPANGAMVAFKQFVRDWLHQTGTAFDQYIDEAKENGSEWVHVGLRNKQGKQRRQELKTVDGGKHYTSLK